MNDNDKPFSELCVISEEETTYKGAIQWHIPEPEIMDFVEKYSTGEYTTTKRQQSPDRWTSNVKCIKSNWFSIGSPSYCSFYIHLYRRLHNYQCIGELDSKPIKYIYQYTDSVCGCIIFYKKPPNCAWIKGKIHFDGDDYPETFSLSAKDFDQKIELKYPLFDTPHLKAILLSSACDVLIDCSMEISMREVKCAFDSEKIVYGESRDYGSSKETVKHDSFTDVKISINDHLFKTHKTVLAQIPYFQELFDANESKQYFELSDIEPEIFNHILTFLYSRDIPYLHFRLAYELYIVASDLKISDLECLCSSYLGANLTETNVFMVLKLSDMFKDVALKKECLKFIKGGDIETLSEKGVIL